MEESQYTSESPRTSDPLADILADMSAKLEGISRLERKLDEVTTNFTGELDFLKTEISNLTEARKRDGAELTRLQTSMKGVSRDLQKNEEVQGNIERKINKIDNTSNKNLERIDRLEQNTAKLSENLKLLEEGSLGARPKSLENPSKEKPLVKNPTEVRNLSEARNRTSYSDQLSKGMDGLRSLNLLKELRMSEERDRNQENLRNRKLNILSEGDKNIDLFSDARRCIGLFPVKASHILDFYVGDYAISPEDIPQHPDLRLEAAKEFLTKELKWNEQVEMKTNWSSERNILWVTFPNENFVSSIFKRQAFIGRPNVRLLKYIPQWCYDRNKELEIQCRLERERDPELRTKILLGHRDLILSIKRKGDMFYKRVPVELFGKLPGFNFLKVAELSPGAPPGRKSFSGEEEIPSRSRKRTERSESTSPTGPEAVRQKVTDISQDDDAWNGFTTKDSF